MLELIFFTADSMGLCFGLVLEKVLITQGWFSYCWAGLTQGQGPSCTREWAGGAQGVRGHIAGTADPNQPKGHPRPCGVMLGKEEEGGMFRGWHLSSKSPLDVMSLLSCGRLITCLSLQWMNSLCCSAWLLLYLFSSLYLHWQVFSISLFQSFPHPTGGCVGMSCQLGLNHDNSLHYCWMGTR